MMDLGLFSAERVPQGSCRINRDCSVEGLPRRYWTEQRIVEVNETTDWISTPTWSVKVIESAPQGPRGQLAVSPI